MKLVPIDPVYIPIEKDDNFLNRLKLVAVGRRKTSIAKVMLIRGNGNIYINGKKFDSYLQFNVDYIRIVKSPLIRLKLENVYDIKIKTYGGGIKGQVDAIKLGIARALCKSRQYPFVYSLPLEQRISLKLEGYLVCDARRKERKKYGLRKARKAPQYSKR